MNESSPAGGTELELDEAFHRIKRTVMLLCGSLILLGSSLAVAQPTEAMKEGLGLEHASPVMLRAALFGAACYYFWGFCHQFLAAIRLNADKMDASALADYESQTRALVKQIETHEDAMNKFQAALAAQVEELPAKLDQAFSQIADPKDLSGFGGGRSMSFSELNRPRLQSSDPAISGPAHAEMAAIWPAAIEEHRQMALQSLPSIAGAVNGLSTTQSGLTLETKRLADLAGRAADRIRTNKRIYRDRWFSFWIWEGASTVVVFAIAMLFTFSTVGFSLAAFLTRLFTVG